MLDVSELGSMSGQQHSKCKRELNGMEHHTITEPAALSEDGLAKVSLKLTKELSGLLSQPWPMTSKWTEMYTKVSYINLD